MAERGMPHAIDAERALLGGLLSEPLQLQDVTEIVTPGDFYRPEHASLFELMCNMSREERAIDPVTVMEEIQHTGRPERYGGPLYTSELHDSVPAAMNLVHYAELVRERSLQRQVIEAARNFEHLAMSGPEDVGALIDDAARTMLKIGQHAGRSSWSALSLIIDAEHLKLQQRSELKAEVTGHSTGFTALDAKLAGFQRTDLLILAARPAMGKTALVLNFARNVATISGAGVGVFSMEMSRGQLVTRLMCCEALIDAGKVRTGKLESDDWEALLDAQDHLRKLPLYIDDTPGLSITDLRARAKRLKGENPGLGLLIIDYLQLMRGDDPRAPREQQISSISRGLKALAKDLDVAVIALSQLNRAVEARADKRPLVSDLRESGAIEQDADVIMFIYRDDYYDKESVDKGLAEVIIAKQRNGPTGTVKLAFQGQFTRFDNFEGADMLLD